MTKIWALIVGVVSLLFVAPVIESATSVTTEIFQAIGTACGGAC